MPEKLNITDWALQDRPREKLMVHGRQSLTDAELIAILIGSGSTKETAVELAKRILNSVDNNLHLLGKQSISDLMKFKGIGEAKAISIVAALELGRRRKLSDVLEKKQIKKSQDVFALMNPILSDLPHEEFWVLFLNRKNDVLDKQKIGQGGIHSTSVDIRLIMKAAIEKLAVAIILCHNHPTGNLKASNADLSLTKQIVKAAEIMDISVLDHLIIGEKEYFSFKDEGLI